MSNSRIPAHISLASSCLGGNHEVKSTPGECWWVSGVCWQLLLNLPPPLSKGPRRGAGENTGGGEWEATGRRDMREGSDFGGLFCGEKEKIIDFGRLFWGAVRTNKKKPQKVRKS